MCCYIILVILSLSTPTRFITKTPPHLASCPAPYSRASAFAWSHDVPLGWRLIHFLESSIIQPHHYSSPDISPSFYLLAQQGNTRTTLAKPALRALVSSPIFNWSLALKTVAYEGFRKNCRCHLSPTAPCSFTPGSVTPDSPLES
jgi:hypothetical protein